MPEPYYEEECITIYHQDCRAVLSELLTGRPCVVITDPPYGIGRHSNDRTGRFHGPTRRIANDHNQDAGAEVVALLQQRRLPQVVFASPMKPWVGQWRDYLVWDKGPAVGGGGDPGTCWKRTWELIQVAHTGLLTGNRDGAVLKYWISPQVLRLHPAAKPVELMHYLIRKVAPVDAVIIDPFAGSGSTLLAAKDLGRTAIGIEVEERYCDYMAERIRVWR